MSAKNREQYAERRLLDLCVECGAPAVLGKSKCEPHREYHRKWNARRRASDPDYRRRQTESVKKWQKENPAKAKESRRKTVAKNPEKYKAISHKSAAKRRRLYPEKMQAKNRKAAKKYQEQNPNGYNFLQTRLALQNAVLNPELKNGWPDACRTEVKIYPDHLQPNQCVRFAWLDAIHGISVKIQWAKSHEDLQLKRGSFRQFSSVAKFLAFVSPELVSIWTNLLDKVKTRYSALPSLSLL